MSLCQILKCRPVVLRLTGDQRPHFFLSMKTSWINNGGLLGMRLLCASVSICWSYNVTSSTAHRLQSDHVMRHQVMIYGWKAGNRYWLNFQNRFWGLKRELNDRLCVVSNSRFSLLPPCENDKEKHISTLIMCSLFTGPLIHKKSYILNLYEAELTRARHLSSQQLPLLLPVNTFAYFLDELNHKWM